MPKQQEDSKPRPLTYRVQEIPLNWGKKKLKAAFSEADRLYVTVKSLVPDVMNYHNNDGTDTLTATVLFSPPEPREPSLLSKWKAELELDRDFGGFTPLNDPEDDVSGDIIAVTGLAGHAFGSWANGPDRMWLRDFLPSTISNARVLVYGYRTPLQGIEQPKSILTEHADSFMNDLLTIRHNPACQDRPLVLIGHSLGGLIIKEFIVSLEEEVRCRLPIRSLVFFGVPHLGLETNGTLASMVNGQPSQTLVHELNRDSPTIIALTKQFMRVLRDAPFIVHSLYESQPTKTVVKNNAGQWVREGDPVVMVPHSSAILRHDKEKHAISVKGDHSAMVKLKKGQGSCYPSVSQWIKEDLKNATEVFNGLHSKAQAPVNEHTNRDDPGRKPSMNLPLLGTRRDKLQIPPPPAKQHKHAFQVPKQSTPSSSDNASDSEEEPSDSEEEPARQGAKDYDNKRKFTPFQMTQDTSRDLCLVIHNKVYDCSSFVGDHPGGEEVLFDCAGDDATEAFEDVGHSNEAREMLEGLWIRDIIRLTPVDVMKHDTSRDLYMIIHDKVYDLTLFLNEHPGGEEVLLDCAGADATEAFEDAGHDDEAREILEGFCMGDVEKTPSP